MERDRSRIEEHAQSGIISSLDCALLDSTKSLDYYDKLRSDSSVIAQVDGFNRSQVVQLTTSESESYRLCNIAAFLALSDGGTNSYRVQSEDEVAAVLLAVHHFNNGIDFVVPQLRDLPSRCNVRLTADIFDTRYSPMETVRTLMSDMVLKRSHTALTPHPCGIVGVWRSAVSKPLGTVASVLGLPVLSYGSKSAELDNKDEYPLFGRTLTSNKSDMAIVVEYYLRGLGVSHVGMLYVKEAWGISYQTEFQLMAEKSGMTLHVESVSYDTNERSAAQLRASIKRFKERGYKYFFCAIYAKHFRPIMKEAVMLKMAGRNSDTHWILAELDHNNFLHQTEHTANDPFSQITSLGLFQGSGGVPGTPGRESYDRFLKEWADMNRPEIRQYVLEKLPVSLFDVLPDLSLGSSFTKEPKSYTYYAYDAVIAYGLAACGVESEQGFNGLFSGEELYHAYLDVEFDGASGPVKIDNTTGSRDGKSAIYTLDNALANNQRTAESVPFTILPSMYYSEGKWLRRHDGQDFIYSDGTTNPPPSLPPWNHDPNLIGRGGHIAGITMFALIASVSIYFAWWTWQNRFTRVVKSAQPVFLYKLTFGVFVTGCTIITMGMEEPISKKSLDISCMASVWLFSVGFAIMFACLFAKTWRINQILNAPNMMRVKVEAHQVMKPAVVMVSTNVIILSIWTAVAPLRYERVYKYGTATDQYGRTMESYGACVLPSNDNGSTWWAGVFFVMLIGAVNALVLLFALYQEYKAWDIETEFSESKCVALSMISMLQAGLLGVVLFFLVWDMPMAHYIIFSTILFITCQAILLLIFVPKVFFLREWKQKQVRRELSRERKKQKPSWLINAAEVSMKILGKAGKSPGLQPTASVDRKTITRAAASRQSVSEGTHESSEPEVGELRVHFREMKYVGTQNLDGPQAT